MRAVWIDDGNTFHADKLRAHSIQSVYYAANSQQATRNEFEAARAAGFGVGVYAAWNWESWTPEEFAQWVHQRLLAIGSPLNPWVCLDIETHDVTWIRRALVEWRKLRPSRRTDWTLEPMQGGLFSLDDAKAINGLGIGVVPQHYGGAMQPFAADRVAIDLIARGFGLLTIQGFYDAATLPLEWSGFAFTQGRLP